jgi:hypothetical protein
MGVLTEQFIQECLDRQDSDVSKNDRAAFVKATQDRIEALKAYSPSP